MFHGQGTRKAMPRPGDTPAAAVGAAARRPGHPPPPALDAPSLQHLPVGSFAFSSMAAHSSAQALVQRLDSSS